MKAARYFALFVLALWCTADDLVVAAEPAPRELKYGDYVMPREECEIRAHGQIVSIKGRMTPFIVQKVEGDVVDIGFGKTKAAHLVHLDDAHDYYTSWIERQPQSVDAYHLRALTHGTVRTKDKSEQRREAEVAIEDLTKAIELAPDVARLYTRRGSLYLGMTDEGGRLTHVDLALKDAENALRRDPEEVWAVCIQWLVNVGRVQRLQANSLHVRLFRYKPRDELSHYWLGCAFAESGITAGAIEHFTKALEINPTSSSALSERAHIYRTLKLYDKSIADYELAMKVDPNEVALHVDWAKTLGYVKREKQMLTELAKALERAPDVGNYMLAYAEALVMAEDASLRNGPLALEYAKKAYAKKSNYRSTFFLGICHAEVGDFKTATEYMLKAREIGSYLPSDPEESLIDKAVQRFSRKLPLYHD